MALASTSTFDPTRDDLIKDCLTHVGAIGPGGTPTDFQRQHASRLLNMLTKSIDKEGKLIWRYDRREQALSSGTGSYTLNADVIDVMEPMNVRVGSASTRSPLSPMTEEDFMRISDRTTTGTPSLYLVEKRLAAVTIRLDPLPNAAMTLEYLAVLKGRDWGTSGNDTGDFPQRWQITLYRGLSSLLFGSYRQRAAARDEWQFYELELAKAKADMNENVGAQWYPVLR